MRARHVDKPRTLLWEWLVLANESPLRTVLREIAGDAFDFLPTLTFTDPESPLGGRVERVALDPLGTLSRAKKRELAEITGRFIALFSWLGVTDLHWENLVLGKNKKGRTIFAPLDVEMFFSDFALPTETKLLPDADPEYAAVCRHAAGVRRVLPYLGKPVAAEDLVAMVSVYRATLDLLETHARTIASRLKRVPGIAEAPIRVCLRGTAEYVDGDMSTLWPPLLESEIEQLERGDIPYFFRIYGKKGLRYFNEPSLRSDKALPSTGDVPQLEPLLPLAKNLQSPSRAKLREEGLLTLIGAFDHPSFKGNVTTDETTIVWKGRSIQVTLPSGETLECPRNLSAIVGSVYLPCTCGEVRSVFVPPVTRCRFSA